MTRIYAKHNSRKPKTIQICPSAHVQKQIDTITNLLIRRWKLTDKPSLSLLLQAVILSYAERAKHNPKVLDSTIKEIQRHGYGLTKEERDGFKKVSRAVNGATKVALH